ncbi:EAL domain-containing protein [Citrobacter freundii]|nr:EAL domain-containing protein [Citrobacter freundii]MBC6509563.1 EAL domain-containing protein [Citrobacter freundii]
MNDNKSPPDILKYYIEKEWVTPYFQPVVDMRNGRCCGAEVLARVIHPEYGVLLPSAFILPETSEGALALLTRTLMECAGSVLQNVPLGRDFMLSFNISPDMVTATWLPEACKTLHRINPDIAGVLELTEQRQLKNTAADIRRHVALLRETGMRLALDDFGTGYSSLLLLLQTGGDILKIPREIVTATGYNPLADKIIDNIIHLADSLGMNIIAEGVEQAGQAERLLSCGVRFIQGAYYSMPLSGEMFTDWLCHRAQTNPGPFIVERMTRVKTVSTVKGAVTECARRHALSLRETEVLLRLTSGQPLLDMARQVNRSVKTCSVQKRSAYRKMGVRNDVEFMHYLYSFIAIRPEIPGHHYDRMMNL